MFTKKEIKAFIIKVGNWYLFPKFINVITKTIISLGGILIATQTPSLWPSLFNWLIQTFNEYFNINLPSFNEEPNYWLLGIGIFLIIIGLHFYYKIESLDIIKNKSKLDDLEISNLLGVLANDIRECIEGSEIMVRASDCGPKDSPINISSIQLKNYESIKNDLIKASVFTSREWSILDKIVDEVITVNDYNANHYKIMAGSRIYHAANFFNDMWHLVMKKYIEHGGNPNDLVKPFRTDNLAQYLPELPDAVTDNDQ